MKNRIKAVVSVPDNWGGMRKSERAQLIADSLRELALNVEIGAAHVRPRMDENGNTDRVEVEQD